MVEAPERPPESRLLEIGGDLEHFARKKQAFDNDCKRADFCYDPVAVQDEAVRFVDQFVGMLRGHKTSDIQYTAFMGRQEAEKMCQQDRSAAGADTFLAKDASKNQDRNIKIIFAANYLESATSINKDAKLIKTDWRRAKNAFQFHLRLQLCSSCRGGKDKKTFGMGRYHWGANSFCSFLANDLHLHPWDHRYYTELIRKPYGKECDAVAEYYADCFGELETESEGSSVQGENADESTGVSVTADRGKARKPGHHSHASRDRQMKRMGSGKITPSLNSGSGSGVGNASEARHHNSNVSSSAVSGARKGVPGQRSSQFQNLGSGLPQNIPRHQQVVSKALQANRSSKAPLYRAHSKEVQHAEQGPSKLAARHAQKNRPGKANAKKTMIIGILEPTPNARLKEDVAATPQCKDKKDSDEEDFIPGTSARKPVAKAAQMQQPKPRQLTFPGLADSSPLQTDCTGSSPFGGVYSAFEGATEPSPIAQPSTWLQNAGVKRNPAARQSLHNIFRGLAKSPIAPKPAPPEKHTGMEKQPESQLLLLSPPHLAKALVSPAGPPSSKRRRILASPSLGLGKRILQTPVKQAETGERNAQTPRAPAFLSTDAQAKAAMTLQQPGNNASVARQPSHVSKDASVIPCTPAGAYEEVSQEANSVPCTPLLSGQITGAVAAARAISFDPPSKAVLVAAGARGEEAACNKKSAQLGTPVSGSGLLQAAADIFTGPFSPELNGANENTSAKQKAERHPQPRLMQPQARLELISAYSLRLEEPRAIQKARKTTKGNLPKQMLLKGGDVLMTAPPKEAIASEAEKAQPMNVQDTGPTLRITRSRSHRIAAHSPSRANTQQPDLKTDQALLIASQELRRKRREAGGNKQADAPAVDCAQQAPSERDVAVGESLLTGKLQRSQASNSSAPPEYADGSRGGEASHTPSGEAAEGSLAEHEPAEEVAYLATKTPKEWLSKPLQQVIEVPRKSAAGLATAGTEPEAVAKEENDQDVPPSPSSFLRGLQPLLQSYAAAEHSTSGASSATRSTASASRGDGMTAEDTNGIASLQAGSPLAAKRSTAAAENRAADMPVSSQQQKPCARQPSKSLQSQTLAVKTGRATKLAAGKKGNLKQGQNQQMPQADVQNSEGLNKISLIAKEPDIVLKPSTRRSGRTRKNGSLPKARAMHDCSSAETTEDVNAAKSRSRHVHQKASPQHSLPTPDEEAAENPDTLGPQTLAERAEQLPAQRTRSQHPVLQVEKQLLPIRRKLKAKAWISKPAAREDVLQTGNSTQPSKQIQSNRQKPEEQTDGREKPCLTLRLEGEADPAAASMSSPFEEASLIGFPSQTLDENAPPLWIAASAQLPSETSSEDERPCGDSDADARGPTSSADEAEQLGEMSLECNQGRAVADEEVGGTMECSGIPPNAPRGGKRAGKNSQQCKTKQKQLSESSPPAEQQPAQEHSEMQHASPTPDTVQVDPICAVKGRGKTRQAEATEQQVGATLPGKRNRQAPREWWKSGEKPGSEPEDRRLPMSEKRKAARARSALKKASQENIGGDEDAYDFPSNLEEEFDNLTTITPMVPFCNTSRDRKNAQKAGLVPKGGSSSGNKSSAPPAGFSRSAFKPTTRLKQAQTKTAY